MAMKDWPFVLRRSRRWCRYWRDSELRQPSFPAETFQRLRVFGDVLRKELQRDEATEFRVLGLVDHTHPTTAEFLDDAVVRDGLANHAQARYGGRIDKSMKAGGLAVSHQDCWRKIAITLIDQLGGRRVKAGLSLLIFPRCGDQQW